MKYTKQNKASVNYLKQFVETAKWNYIFNKDSGECTMSSYEYKKLYNSIENVLKLLDDVREEGYVYRIGNEEFRKQEERTLFKKSRLHKDFGKQSFEDLCKQFENDDCDFEYYKRIYADDIDQLIKENYDHIPRID